MLKKFITVFSAMVFLAMFCSAFAQTVQTEAGVISVSSTATKEIEPDIADLVLKIEITGDTAQLASDANKKIANDVIAAIKPLLVPNSKDYIKTSAFVVSPQYVFDKNRAKTINNYVATNSIEVSTKNVQNVGKIIDAATSAGANRVGSLQLKIDNPDCYCTPLLEDATKDTYFKASAVAKAVSKTIVGVKTINTSCNVQNNVGLNYSEAFLSKSVGAAPAQITPIEAGKVFIYANVNSEYFIK